MESNLGDIIKNALESMRSAAGGDTVIGNPINTAGGVVIIPVSKVSMGFASGGLDSDKEKADAQKKGKSFGGGGGSGVSVVPVAFLVVRPDGEVTLLNVNSDAARSSNPIDSVTHLLDKSPDIISRLKTVLKRDKKEEAQNDEPEDDTPDQIVF